MSKYVNAQKLNRRATFQRRVPPLQDDFGQPLDNWQTVFTLWADVNTITGGGFISQEFNSGGLEVSRPTASVRVRKPTLYEITADMRCIIQGVIYEIRVVLPDLQDNRFLDIGVATGANNG